MKIKSPARGKRPRRWRAILRLAAPSRTSERGSGAAPGKDGPSVPGKPSRAPNVADKGGPTAENPPAPTVDPPEPRDASSGVEEKVEYINLSELRPSPLNPFGVRDDVEMQALVESVKTGRVNQPALVRPIPMAAMRLSRATVGTRPANWPGTSICPVSSGK